MLGKILQQLFCRHDWEMIRDDYDISKMRRYFLYRCKKCQKEWHKYWSQ